MSFKKLALVTLVPFMTFTAQASDITATELICSGSIKNNGGLSEETRVAVAVQRAFPSGELQISLAVNGEVQVDRQLARIKANRNSFDQSIGGYTSERVEVTINRAQMDYQTDSYSLTFNGQSIEDLTFNCKEY